MWSKVGLNDMLATDTGYYFVKYISKEESLVVLQGGPWHITGNALILQNWQPGLILQKNKIAKIPI